LKITIFNGQIHYKSPFSIAMLNYQRVISDPQPDEAGGCCVMGSFVLIFLFFFMWGA
jgi:hypothetical protein